MNSIGRRLLTRITERVFVFTLLWIGFILAISFMETPLKFQAPSLTLPVALEIGYRVFHALNAIEIGLVTVIAAITVLANWSRRLRLLLLTHRSNTCNTDRPALHRAGHPHPCYHSWHRGPGAVLSPYLCHLEGYQAAAPVLLDPPAT